MTPYGVKLDQPSVITVRDSLVNAITVLLLSRLSQYEREVPRL